MTISVDELSWTSYQTVARSPPTHAGSSSATVASVVSASALNGTLVNCTAAPTSSLLGGCAAAGAEASATRTTAAAAAPSPMRRYPMAHPSNFRWATLASPSALSPQAVITPG